MKIILGEFTAKMETGRGGLGRQRLLEERKDTLRSSERGGERGGGVSSTQQRQIH